MTLRFPAARTASARSWLSLRILRRWPTSSLVILTVFLFAAIAAPWISPYGPEDGALSDRHIPPLLFGGTSEHVLGTDSLGRDLLTRTIHGARISLMVAVITLVIGGSFGTLIGLISGNSSAWVDEVLMRIVDVKFSLPLILIALAFVILLGASIPLLVGLLAFLIWGGFARQVRAEVLVLKELDFVKSARISGASSARILYRHLLPMVMNTVMVVATLQVGNVILVEASLSFLGAGVPPPTPAWGSMVASGRLYFADAWWVSLVPGAAIMLVVLAFTLFGDWLRDRMDPTLRQAI